MLFVKWTRTAPLALPANAIDSELAELIANVAVTDCGSTSAASWHVVAAPHAASDQPRNVEPTPGAAVSVIIPLNTAEHVEPQSIAPAFDVTLPVPAPASATSSRPLTVPVTDADVS